MRRGDSPMTGGSGRSLAGDLASAIGTQALFLLSFESESGRGATRRGKTGPAEHPSAAHFASGRKGFTWNFVRAAASVAPEGISLKWESRDVGCY
jgi:hypothetical protein